MHFTLCFTVPRAISKALKSSGWAKGGKVHVTTNNGNERLLFDVIDKPPRK